MGRKYSVVFTGVAATTVEDFFELLGAADYVTKLLGFELAQATEIGDAQEEMLNISVKRGVGAVTSGSGGSTATPQPMLAADTAFSGTVEINNTTKMVVGSGSIATLFSSAWNIRAPYEKWFPPGLEPQINGAARLVIGLDTTAPLDSITFNGTVWLEQE